MPEGRKADITEIAEELAEYIKTSVKLLKQVLDPGIGMEEIDAEEFRRRFKSAEGNPQIRQQLVEAVGGERALKLLQGGDK